MRFINIFAFGRSYYLVVLINNLTIGRKQKIFFGYGVLWTVCRRVPFKDWQKNMLKYAR